MMLAKLVRVGMERRGRIKEPSLNQSPQDLLIKPCGVNKEQSGMTPKALVSASKWIIMTFIKLKITASCVCLHAWGSGRNQSLF